MNVRFSPKVSITCALLAAFMVGMSFWQWDRHLQKLALIETLNQTLRLEPVDLPSLLAQNPDPRTLTWRRVKLSGAFDFKHELLLRNRSYEKRAGVHVITPLKVDGADAWVLVDRGFLPLGRESAENRSRYQRPERTEMFGLIKDTMPKKFLAPSDPEAGPGKPWVDQWLRVDVDNIAKQLPYPILPFYLETMKDPNDPLLASQIVKGSEAGRHDVLNVTAPSTVESFGMDSPDAPYPFPAYDTTPPPDIHIGYVYEWAFMALLTLLIGFVLQLRR